MDNFCRAVCIAASILALPSQAMATQQDDIASLSLEDLSNIRVTSVSRRAESAFDAAASIFVISADSIKRAGV